MLNKGTSAYSQHSPQSFLLPQPGPKYLPAPKRCVWTRILVSHMSTLKDSSSTTVTLTV